MTDRMKDRIQRIAALYQGKEQVAFFAGVQAVYDNLWQDVSEDLGKEVDRCWKEIFPIGWSATSKLSLTYDQHLEFARHYANWQKNALLDRACEWLKINASVYFTIIRDPNFIHSVHFLNDKFLEDFRCSMED